MFLQAGIIIPPGDKIGRSLVVLDLIFCELPVRFTVQSLVELKPESGCAEQHLLQSC